jgi:hypothetical protein
MEPSQIKYEYGAFEATDKEDILDGIDKIKDLGEKLAKKQSQGRPTKREVEDLTEARAKLLRTALDVLRRPHPVPARNPAMPKLQKEGLAAARKLFLYLSDTDRKKIDTDVLQTLASQFCRQCKIDGVDYKPVEVEKTPVLSFEKDDGDEDDEPPDQSGIEEQYFYNLSPRANYCGQTGLFEIFENMNWDAPSGYVIPENKNNNNEKDGEDEDAYSVLDWPHKPEDDENRSDHEADASESGGEEASDQIESGDEIGEEEQDSGAEGTEEVEEGEGSGTMDDN